MSPPEQMLDRRENSLRNHLFEHFDMVDKAIENALNSMIFANHDLARSVINNDRNINSKHHQVENECVSIIARMQPMARDLRELLSDMHISAELERIADYASGIANIVTEMDHEPAPEIRKEVIAMGNQCRGMLASIKKAYETYDTALAYQVAELDNNIDKTENDLIDRLFDHQNNNPGDYKSCTHLLWITHSLERIGDRITNIAERVVFIVTGERTYLN